MKVKVMPTRLLPVPDARSPARRMQKKRPRGPAANKQASQELLSAVRVFIVAGSPLARAGLETLLEGRGIYVADSVPTLNDIPKNATSTANIILVDSAGGGRGSLFDSAIASGLASRVSVLLLADGVSGDAVDDAYRAGVKAVLPSEVLPNQLVAALLAAANGLTVALPLQAAPGRWPSTRGPRAADTLRKPLTRREREVLQCLAGGCANKEIAGRLGVSERTVKFHVASILAKLGAATRTDAVALGIRRGLVLL